jgi:hypothetical protein
MRPVVAREEFDELRQRVDNCCRDLGIQLQRIAQIQAELDHIREAWAKTLPRRTRP